MSLVADSGASFGPLLPKRSVEKDEALFHLCLFANDNNVFHIPYFCSLLQPYCAAVRESRKGIEGKTDAVVCSVAYPAYHTVSQWEASSPLHLFTSPRASGFLW